jgi:hypothetical protein
MSPFVQYAACEPKTQSSKNSTRCRGGYGSLSTTLPNALCCMGLILCSNETGPTGKQGAAIEIGEAQPLRCGGTAAVEALKLMVEPSSVTSRELLDRLLNSGIWMSARPLLPAGCRLAALRSRGCWQLNLVGIHPVHC